MLELRPGPLSIQRIRFNSTRTREIVIHEDARHPRRPGTGQGEHSAAPHRAQRQLTTRQTRPPTSRMVAIRSHSDCMRTALEEIPRAMRHIPGMIALTAHTAGEGAGGCYVPAKLEPGKLEKDVALEEKSGGLRPRRDQAASRRPRPHGLSRRHFSGFVPPFGE